MTVFDACLDSKHWKNLRIIVGGHTHTRIHILGCTPPRHKTKKYRGCPRLVLPGTHHFIRLHSTICVLKIYKIPFADTFLHSIDL